MLRLNLGCGKDVRGGWDNIDAYAPNPEGGIRIIKHDVCWLMPAYSRETVDEICAQDVLEHIPHRDVERVFNVWCELLRPGGKLFIQVPDIRRQAQLLIDGTWSARVWSHMTFGGQDGVGNYHHCGFDEDLLRNMFLHNRIRVDGVEHVDHGITPDVATSNNVNIRIWGRKWE